MTFQLDSTIRRIKRAAFLVLVSALLLCSGHTDISFINLVPCTLDGILKQQHITRFTDDMMTTYHQNYISSFSTAKLSHQLLKFHLSYYRHIEIKLSYWFYSPFAACWQSHMKRDSLCLNGITT